MTTFVPFTPGLDAPFQFTATLDGASYTVQITWNVSGQRWYATIATLQGIPVVTIAVRESPAGYDMPITDGYFTSTIVYREPTGQFEISD